jgi:hypothetical protein
VQSVVMLNVIMLIVVLPPSDTGAGNSVFTRKFIQASLKFALLLNCRCDGSLSPALMSLDILSLFTANVARQNVASTSFQHIMTKCR